MRKSILVVEDDPFLRETLVQSLQHDGVDIIEAGDGVMGLEQFQKHQPYMVISDVRMPNMDGLNLLKNIRSQNAEVFFILMTGFSEVTEAKNAHHLGANEFLLKPFELAQLNTIVQTGSSLNNEKKISTQPPVQYCSISIDQFISGRKACTDVYIQLSDKKYILIARKDSPLDLKRIEIYKAKGLSEFHVKKEDFQIYLDLNVKLSKAAMTSSLTTEKKVFLLRNTTEVILQDCAINGLAKGRFEEALGIVENMINIITNEEEMCETLSNFISHSKQSFSHSVSVSMFSCMIARALGWSAHTTVFRLSVGGLLHDIGKQEIPKSILEKKRHKRTFEETKIYESHATRGKDILSAISWVPSEVIQICHQHHENISSTGFPLGLSRSRIHPLAFIVGLADTFCNKVLASGADADSISPHAFIKMIYDQHSNDYDPQSLLGLMLMFDYPIPEDLTHKLKVERKSA
jgi:putative nucleotidyltransferase with HDIG domain